MALIDILWLLAILGGVGYLLYRSFGKKKEHCSPGGGCCGGDCSKH
jgi:hypothetical protein